VITAVLVKHTLDSVVVTVTGGPLIVSVSIICVVIYIVRYSVIDRVGHPRVEELDGGEDDGEEDDLLYDGLDVVDDSVHGVDGDGVELELVTCE
jgi:hypothetical protein